MRKRYTNCTRTRIIHRPIALVIGALAPATALAAPGDEVVKLVMGMAAVLLVVCAILAIVLLRMRKQLKTLETQATDPSVTAMAQATPEPPADVEPVGQDSATASTLGGDYGEYSGNFAPSSYGHVFDSAFGPTGDLDGAELEAGTRLLQVVAQADACLVLKRGRYRVGRSSDNDLEVNDPSVSRYHAEIVYAPHGEYVVNDLQSLNGTYVNGKRLRSARLSPGDRIELGDAELEYLPLGGTENEDAPFDDSFADAHPETLAESLSRPIDMPEHSGSSRGGRA